MKVNGKAISVMGSVSKSGKMVHLIMEPGSIIGHMEMANFIMLMEMYMMVSGNMIRLMGMVSTIMQMVLYMRVLGKMISSSVKAKNFGQMTRSFRGCFLMGRNMDMANMLGLMAPFLKVIGKKAKSQELVLISGITAENTKENGSIIICMAWVFSIGQMGENT